MDDQMVQVHVVGSIPDQIDATGLLSLADTFGKAGHDRLAAYLRGCADKLAVKPVALADFDQVAVRSAFEAGRREGIREARDAIRSALETVELKQ